MKIASRSLLLATAAMAASLATGCLSVTGYDAPCPVRTVEDTLKVSVDAVPTQPESASLASDVASAARRNLANRGFRVVEDGDRDISVSLGVEQTERNRAGDFIIYEGRVCARAAIGAPGSAALDETVIEAAGERKLGEAAATRALSKVLVPQVESWVEKTVTVGKTGVRVQTVSVEYRRVDRLDKPALIDFYADWCGPCKRLAPELEKLAAEYGDQIYIYKVNTEKEQELAALFGIRSIPTLLFIPMTGEPRIAQGALPRNELKKAIDEILLAN